MLSGNSDRLTPTPSVIIRPAVEAVANEIRAPGKAKQRSTGVEKPHRSIAGDEFWSEMVMWKDPTSDILQELRHSDLGNRIAAIQRLHGHDQVEAVRILKAVLSQDEDAYVRGEAIRMLVSIGGEEAFTAMTTALGDTETTVRYQVIEALGEAGSKAIHLLGQVLFGDPDPELRHYAVELIATQDGAAAQALLAAAAQDPDDGVRQQAQLWVREPEWETATAGDNDPTLGSAIVFAPDDQGLEQLWYLDPEDRIAAIQQVYGLDQKDAVRILSQVLSTDEDAHVRSEAISVLASIGEEEAFTALTTALGDTDTTVRYQVIEALGEAGSEAIHLLGQVLFSDPDPQRRRQAVEVIATQDGPAAQALLAVAAQDLDETVRLAASQFLHQR